MLSISVVIPTYNRASLVARAVESALAAMEPTDEILVVDDGSTDGTEQALAPYKDRIRYIKAPHGGAGQSRNRGVAEARHELVAFLDSDDEWFADKLMLQRCVMQTRPDVVFCFSDFVVREESGRTFPRYLRHWHNDPRPPEQIFGPGFCYSSIARLPSGREDFKVHVGDMYEPLMNHPYIGTFTLLFRKNRPGGDPQFPVDLPTYEDWQFFGDLARCGPGAYLDSETAIQHGHRMPRLTHASTRIKAETRIKVLERVWGTDSAFLARHGDAYRRLIEEQHHQIRLACAKELLKAGRMREARAAFAQISVYPRTYRMLLLLPALAVRALVWASVHAMLGVDASLRATQSNGS